MKKSELKEMIKAAFMAENDIPKNDEDYTQQPGYVHEEEDLDEMLARLSEEEVEEVVNEAEEDLEADLEADIDTPEGDEEVDVEVDAEEKAPAKNDSIVIDKKIVSLSSLPGDTRKILDTLETLRAQAEEFGDQKFITQVGNTITFFTRDFVVAGDAPNPAGIEESDESADTKMEAEEMLQESLRMKKLAGIIK